MVNNPSYPCNTGQKKLSLTGGGSGLPLNVIEVGNGEDDAIDCTQFRGTELILPGGSQVTLPCPIVDHASLTSLTSDELPGPLPEGDAFGSAFTDAILRGGVAQSTVDGVVTVSFVVPDRLKKADLAILFWDGSKWVDLNGAIFGNGKNVFDPGHGIPDGHFEAQVNFTGTFALVGK
jgi:hypothetical protein